jgi:hypothetical protein
MILIRNLMGYRRKMGLTVSHIVTSPPYLNEIYLTNVLEFAM